jgi:predicted porin
MKKSLFALAAVTAFAGAAQAQSSVTVYGILDVGYIGGNSAIRSSAITNNGGAAKTTVSQFGQSAETTSRLGFRGTEDLGGGMAAFFTAEFQLYPQDQGLSGNTTGGLQNRQSFVGLSKKGMGQFAVGTQYTPVFSAGAATSPGQYNNITGDVIYQGAPYVSTKSFDNNGTYALTMTNRTSNTLTVQTERFAGLVLSGMYTMANQDATQTAPTTGGVTNANGWGIGGNFTFQKLLVTAAYQSLKQDTTSSTTVTPWTGAQPSAGIPTSTTNATGTAAANASNIKDNQYLAGAVYDFGILKAYVQYVNRKATSALDSNQYVSRTGQQIGVRSFITPKIEGWASVGNGRFTTYGSSSPTANVNGYQLGANYLLSKRTNLYGIFGGQNTSTASSATASGSANVNSYAVGVRHTF